MNLRDKIIIENKERVEEENGGGYGAIEAGSTECPRPSAVYGPRGSPLPMSWCWVLHQGKQGSAETNFTSRQQEITARLRTSMNKLLVDEQFEIEMTWAARSKYHATASLGWLSDHEISECGVANIMAHNFYNKRS
ncbi:unnamed protein product [Fusarium graminearum]|uniref:Chromosome 3, complete genome n=1 Tax=Gibberella zeae (strain ATCC MYA-4620 / CBS 123657 / FGSC 9075 / NRRL 31084 / PH-1) TaxID=229533 RepID=I1SAK4_GIBZE|nr:hypothetical protein FGSG_13885 [Fusarium graminearum PH-1]ESU17812.1 hypothetical protein FGSG_13885 [Fusarium graminearum PH-1]CEF87138.1 unnamed protein product [Fusarium graminearum]CZS85521.1 unnamed protein product [Fusarium graminearum]|eukprot:XP_011325434.1 hypothetical protein FGSG_13885 [Fusarium graminearum PH-1]